MACFWIIGLCALIGMSLLRHWYYRHWREAGVDGPSSLPILGHFLQLNSILSPSWISINKMYRKFKGGKFWGLYDVNVPVLVISDLDIISDLTTKHKHKFVFCKNIFSNLEEQPAFSKMVTHCHSLLKSKKLKGSKFDQSEEKYRRKSFQILALNKFKKEETNKIFNIINEKLDNLIENYISMLTKSNKMQVKPVIKRCYEDVIATYYFGEENTSSIFLKKVLKLYKFGIIKKIKTFIFVRWPKFAKTVKIKLAKELQYFCDLFKQSIIKRNFYTGAERGDIIDFIQKLNTSDKPLSYEIINIDAVRLLHPGAEATTALISNVLLMLAKYPLVQEKLRKQLKSLSSNLKNEASYESLQNSYHLNCIILETMRLTGPLMAVEYSCVEDYKIPDTEVIIKPGTRIRIPVFSIHQDEEFWADASKFKPERFLTEQNAINWTGCFPLWHATDKSIGSLVTEMTVQSTVSRIVRQFHLQAMEKQTNSSKTKNVELIFSKLDHF